LGEGREALLISIGKDPIRKLPSSYWTRLGWVVEGARTQEVGKKVFLGEKRGD